MEGPRAIGDKNGHTVDVHFETCLCDINEQVCLNFKIIDSSCCKLLTFLRPCQNVNVWELK